MEIILPGETLSVLLWFGIAVFVIANAVLIANKHLTTFEKFVLCLGTFFVPIIGGLFALGWLFFQGKK